MHPDNQRALENRVTSAAEAALAHHHYVSAIDVLTGTGLLSPAHLQEWRKGRIDFLERVIHTNLKKISLSMAIFRRWAQAKGLKPSETGYVRWGRGQKVELRFSKSGDPGIERSYRTHFVSPDISERKKQEMEERLSRPPERVAFLILRDSRCSECGIELEQGSLLYMEADQALCLACAGLGDLEYLPAGDAALTRRAAKHSARKAVVVQFSRSRGRYERQGILVEEPALQKAEEDCELDAGERAKERQRRAAQLPEQDRKLALAMARRIQEFFPRCPPAEAQRIAEHTAVRGSGRVGRTAPGRGLDEQALTLAVVAAVRHQRTAYDALLASGLDRPLAREQVRDQVEETLAAWRGPAD
jgi:Uncharacterized conserved protein